MSCLSCTSPSQYVQYQNRLHIVDFLIVQYPLGPLLTRGILGNNLDQLHLFPLFDLIFYSLIQERIDLETFAWKIFLNIHLTKDLIGNLQTILQNTFVYNHSFTHVIHLSQRLIIPNYFTLLIHYLERVTFDAQPNRFSLLLYLIYVDQGLTILQTINDCFRLSLNTSRRCLLNNLIKKCRATPEKLKFYCRRTIRNVLARAIHCKLEVLDLNYHLKNYILLDELLFLPF